MKAMEERQTGLTDMVSNEQESHSKPKSYGLPMGPPQEILEQEEHISHRRKLGAYFFSPHTLPQSDTPVCCPHSQM